MYGIFLYPDVRDVALAQLAIGVDLAEAGLDYAALLVFEAFGARHASRGRARLLGGRGRGSMARLRVQSAIRARHVEGRVGTIAHFAVTVGRRAGHCGKGGVVSFVNRMGIM